MKKLDQFTKTCRDIDDELLQAQGYLSCLRCGRSDLPLEHHHIYYRSEMPMHPELHSKANVLLCCKKCHEELHSNKSLREDIVLERGLDKIFIK